MFLHVAVAAKTGGGCGSLPPRLPYGVFQKLPVEDPGDILGEQEAGARRYWGVGGGAVRISPAPHPARL